MPSLMSILVLPFPASRTLRYTSPSQGADLTMLGEVEFRTKH